MMSVCFKIGLDLDDLIPGYKNSPNIFLSGNNFLLIRLSFTMLSLLFSSICSLWFPITGTFTYSITKFFIFDYP